MDKTMESLKSMLCDELEEIVNTGRIGASDLDSVHKITDTIKNVYKIDTLKEGEYSYYGNDGYSNDGDWRANGTYSRGRHYVRGHYSNANERDMLASRMNDMMRNTSMSSEDKDTLRRAMDMLR